MTQLVSVSAVPLCRIPHDDRAVEPQTMSERVSAVFKIVYYSIELARKASLKKSVVFLGRSFANLRKSIHWIDFIERYGRAKRLGHPPLELVRKSLGTYFVYRSPAAFTQRLLFDHFDICARAISRPALEALWQGRVVPLQDVQGRKDVYHVSLCRADQAGARHEGELTVQIRVDSLPTPLFRATFIFVTAPDGGVSLAIGGLQGPGVDGAKQALVAATRDLNGLRPKDALVLTLKGLAQRLGARELYAVANASHVINRRRTSKRDQLLNDYDAYWRDRGGHEGGEFGFILPVGEAETTTPANRRDANKQIFWQIGARPI